MFELLCALLRFLCVSGEAPARAVPRRARPHLESLECRAVPASYTWKGAEGADWNVAGNWSGPVGGTYPKSDADEAIFDGDLTNMNAANTSVKVNEQITIGRIVTKNGYNKEIKLDKDLNIKKVGAGLGDSSIDSPVKFAPLGLAGTLSLYGVRMDVTQGELGSTAVGSDLWVVEGATLNLNLKSGVKLGMRLYVGVNAMDTGSVSLKDADPGFQGRNLTVFNNASIYVRQGSTFTLAGKDGDGWILNNGLTPGSFWVSGKLVRAGSQDVKVSLPVLVTGAAGELSVSSPDGPTTLTVDSTGNGLTGNNSILVDGGSVKVENATLAVAGKIYLINNGALKAQGAADSFVLANIVRFAAGSRLDMVDAGGTFTTLRFNLFGPAAGIQFTNGTMKIDAQGGSNIGDRIIVTGGNMAITNVNTTLEVNTIGLGVSGDTYFPIEVQGGTLTGDFATKPAGFTCDIVVSAYRVRRT